jgi:lysozyme family protein
MSDFNQAIGFVLKNEGGLVEDPNDPGGTTNFGISLRFYKQAINKDATSYEIENLSQQDAINIYQKQFWDNQQYFLITEQIEATYILDMAVNMGPAIAHKIAQRATWAMFAPATSKKLADDGVMGIATINALNNPDVDWSAAMVAMRAERAGYYRLLAAQTPNLQKFLPGWLNRAYSL